MENNKKVLGVIGGLGPMATAYFMELVISMTNAARDQDHLQMIVYNYPTIPDRTAYILKKNPNSPVPEMTRIAKLLEQQQAGCIAIPCVTAHYFWKEVNDSVDITVLNAPKATGEHLRANGIRKVGIMATDGTIATGLLQNVLEKAGMEVLLPDEESQQGVMDLIYRDIKANRPPDMDLFRTISSKLHSDGAEVIVLACTELSLIKRDYSIGAGFIDALQVLAQQAVLACGGELKEEYRCLITK